MIREFTYAPGVTVFRRGIYEALHARNHQAPEEGELVAGEHFPYCNGCKSAVRFRFVREIGEQPVRSLRQMGCFNESILPVDVESLFRAAFGRSMTQAERSRIRDHVPMSSALPRAAGD